jgi:hypothetical protein
MKDLKRGAGVGVGDIDPVLAQTQREAGEGIKELLACGSVSPNAPDAYFLHGPRSAASARWRSAGLICAKASPVPALSGTSMPCSRRHCVSLTRAASCAFDVPDDADPPDDATGLDFSEPPPQAASAATEASTANRVRNRRAKDMGASSGVVAGRSGRCPRTS